jgi:hypothetical protein
VHEKKYKFGFKALSNFVSKMKDVSGVGLKDLENNPSKVTLKLLLFRLYPTPKT